jgi:hypothetical protein
MRMPMTDKVKNSLEVFQDITFTIPLHNISRGELSLLLSKVKQYSVTELTTYTYNGVGNTELTDDEHELFERIV